MKQKGNITLNDHEFANWLIKKNLDNGTTQKHKKKFAEKDVEDYLVDNLGVLEKGLSFQDRQVLLPTGRADILALDSSGNKVFIELKAKPMNPGDVHKLCGQVSTYFNTINMDENARFIIVVLKDGSDHNYKIWHGLKHWLDKVKIFQFEIVSNGDYCFSIVEYL